MQVHVVTPQQTSGNGGLLAKNIGKSSEETLTAANIIGSSEKYTLEYYSNQFGEIVVRYTLPTYDEATLRIYDAYGRIVEEKGLSGANQQGSIIIDVGKWSTGLYIGTLFINGKRVATRKILH